MRQHKTPCNDFIFREVHPVPPPIDLDVTSHENPSQSDEKLSSYALRLIRRLLNIADADYTDVSFKDRDMLEDALSGTSIEEIARHKKLSCTRIRQRLNKALDFLGLKMSRWENLQKQLDEVGEDLKKLQADAVDRKKKLDEMSQLVSALGAENDYLRSIVKAYSEKQPKPSPELMKVDKPTGRILSCDLKSIGVPPTIAISFAAHKIRTVIDIIRYSDRELAELDGISDDDIANVKQALKKYDMELGTDIRYVLIENDYYIYP